jgi:ATP-dependent Lhr-like helicase
VHPETRQGRPEGLADALHVLEGLPLPAGLWEQAVLPARVPAYQPRWLDEWVAGGAGAWVRRGEDGDAGVAAFLGRETLGRLAPPAADGVAPGEGAARVLDSLGRRGACFVDDLARDTGLSPGAVRAGLAELCRRGLATNDRFDVVRRGGLAADSAEAPPGPPRVLRGPLVQGVRRPAGVHPEGRWSLVPWGRPSPEEQAVAQAGLLLRRYGVVARELALLDPWLAPWRVLYEVLSRMELAGEVRRGYFVEGLSGAQFASPEAAAALQDLHLPSTATAPVVLLHSLDPANLYGSGAPFDVALLDGGTRPLLRRPGNALVLRAGRPVLLAEQSGRRLTALPSASPQDVTAAVAVLPGLLDHLRGAAHKITVEEWNGRPVTATEGRAALEAAGFVRDYQGMTLYAAWQVRK